MPTIYCLPSVESCCCLLDLPIGSLVIAVLDMFMSIIFTVYPILAKNCEEDETCLWDYLIYYCYFIHFLCIVAGCLIIIAYRTEQRTIIFIAVVMKMVIIFLYLVTLIINFVALVIADVMVVGFVVLLAGIIILSVFAYHVCIINSWNEELEECGGKYDVN